jgi:protein-tyrosine phosphatase
MTVDHTRIDLHDNPLEERMSGVARHGMVPFDVPYISEIGPNLYQGGCRDGLTLPTFIKHVVSLYKWEAYEARHELLSSMFVTMYDAEDQGFSQVDVLANWINECRRSGAVLVHCQAGLNRSSLIAARALFLGGGFTTGDEIVEHLRASRSPACLCNKAFEDEVRSWGSP